MTRLAAPPLQAIPPDPHKHVMFTVGMVLGQSDFDQEFAYLSNRDQWLARDAIGYGTLNGLRVTTDVDGANGPRVTISSGSALTPRGQLVCVSPAQCGTIKDWLAQNQSAVTALGSPGTISLYLTLCYRDCAVDPVPIPGEPCRTEEQLFAPARLVDDFLIELRTAPPDQREEDLLNQFLDWMRNLSFQITPAVPASIPAFQSALRASVFIPPLPAPGDPPQPVQIFAGDDINALQLDSAHRDAYIDAALLTWVTYIRPLVHTVCSEAAPDDCLLLARLEVPLLHGTGGAWVADDSRPVEIDEARRPFVADPRLLQDRGMPRESESLVVSSPSAAILADSGAEETLSNVTAEKAELRMAAAAPPSTGVSTVAAGIAGADFVQVPVFNNLHVTLDARSGRLRVSFDGYRSPGIDHQYVVTATPLANPDIPNPTIVVDGYDDKGIFLRVTNGASRLTAAKLKTMRFMLLVNEVE